MINLHTHSTFSDGKNTPEEIINEAIRLGMEKIGFSDHSYVPFDSWYCMHPEVYPEYQKEIRALAEKYKDRIEVLCGIEQDYYTEVKPDGFDYIIGSMHYILIDGNYVHVDWKEEILKDAAEKYFGRDIMCIVELYFEQLTGLFNKVNADMIGHVDLITKFNENDRLFDTKSQRYIKAWKSCVDELLKHNVPFEINTGAISRGYRTTPYPSADIKEYIIKNGGKLIYSSDSHSKDTLCFGFDE